MPSASDIYAQALQQQNSLMRQASSGYAQTINTLRADSQRITQGYNQLSNSVLGELTNLGRSAAQDIADQYTALSGNAAQSLTSRGLGNTTISDSINRGLAYDKAKADVNLMETVGRTRADYMTQIGLSGLGYQGSAAAQIAQLGAGRAGTIAGFAPTYASLYSRMADFQERQDQQPYDMAMAMFGMGNANSQQNALRSAQSLGAAKAQNLANRQLGFKQQALNLEAASTRQSSLQNAANQMGASMERRYMLGGSARSRSS